MRSEHVHKQLSSHGQFALGATTLVAIGIIAGNASGFLREAVIAGLFGTTRTADVFLIAFTVPEFLFTLLTTTVAAALIPTLVRNYATPDRAAPGLPSVAGRDLSDQRGLDAKRVVFSILYLALLLLPLSIASVLTLPLYLPWLAPGFSHDELLLAIDLSRIMMAAVVVWGLAAALSAILNSLRQFLIPSLATAAYNLGFVVVAVAWHDRFGAHALAWGVLLGSAASLALQVPRFIAAVRHLRSKTVFAELDGFQAWVYDLGRIAAMVALGYTLHHLSIIVDRSMASGLAVGSVAALNYAYRVPLMIGQVLGIAVATVLFPQVAREAAAGSVEDLRDTLRLGLRVLVFLGMPAIVGLTLLREPVVRMMFQRGAFDDQAVRTTAGLLVFFSLGVLADMLCQPLWRAVYAIRDSASVVYVNGFKTTIRFALNVALVPLFSAQGIAISFSIGLFIQLAILVAVVSRHTGSLIDWQLTSFLIRITLASSIMAVVVYSIQGPLAAISRQGMQATFLMTLATALTGGLVYAVATYALRIGEVDLSVHWAVQRFRRTREQVVG